MPKFLELGQDAVVVDIGAHIGFFSVMAAKIARELYSFEPNPDNVLLRTNLAINGIGNVVVAQEAVADKPGYYRYL